MFYECKSLTYLPDISKWNTNNVTNMENIFYECWRLENKPKISKQNEKYYINKKQI